MKHTVPLLDLKLGIPGQDFAFSLRPGGVTAAAKMLAANVRTRNSNSDSNAQDTTGDVTLLTGGHELYHKLASTSVLGPMFGESATDVIADCATDKAREVCAFSVYDRVQDALREYSASDAIAMDSEGNMPPTIVVPMRGMEAEAKLP